MELTKLLHNHFTLLCPKRILTFPISRHFAKTMFLELSSIIYIAPSKQPVFFLPSAEREW